MSAGTKGEGFGVKILKEIIKLRKERKNERAPWVGQN
ncbi:GapR family DNA-binding domain-containing protein, partial [Bradyrhizobium liaoningense]